MSTHDFREDLSGTDPQNYAIGLALGHLLADVVSDEGTLAVIISRMNDTLHRDWLPMDGPNSEALKNIKEIYEAIIPILERRTPQT